MSDLSLRDAVLHTIGENALLHPGDRVLVAISGGADSVCLLHLLHELAPEMSLFLHAAHLDHSLRPESGEDAAFVGRLCARLGVPLTIATLDVAGEAQRRGLGIEETARAVRREFLRQSAAACGCRSIALGHHRGDQAETVLHRLLRGSGSSGLAGMRPREGAFIRPLIGVGRQQILAYLRRQRLSWVEDASNLDLAFTRNRLRHQVLPLLAEFNPRIEEHLARLGSRLGSEEDFWRQQTEEAFFALAQAIGDDLYLDCGRLRQLHPALRIRVAREALRRLRGDLLRVEAVHLEQIEKLLHGRQSQGELHLPGAWVGRRYERLWLRRTPPPEPPAFAVDIPGAGTFPLPGGRLHVELAPTSQGEDPLAVEFAAAAVEFPLRVRTCRPGDRFRPAGMAGSKKLKDFFIDAKVAREVRRRTLLVEEKEILWLIGFRRCAGRQAGSDTVLRLRFQPLPS